MEEENGKVDSVSKKTRNQGVFSHLKEFHSIKSQTPKTSRQVKSARFKALFSKAQILSSQNNVSLIVLAYSENPVGPDTVNGRAFGARARDLLYSSKGIEFSMFFRENAVVEKESEFNFALRENEDNSNNSPINDQENLAVLLDENHDEQTQISEENNSVQRNSSQNTNCSLQTKKKNVEQTHNYKEKTVGENTCPNKIIKKRTNQNKQRIGTPSSAKSDDVNKMPRKNQNDSQNSDMNNPVKNLEVLNENLEEQTRISERNISEQTNFSPNKNSSKKNYRRNEEQTPNSKDANKIKKKHTYQSKQCLETPSSAKRDNVIEMPSSATDGDFMAKGDNTSRKPKRVVKRAQSAKTADTSLKDRNVKSSAFGGHFNQKAVVAEDFQSTLFTGKQHVETSVSNPNSKGNVTLYLSSAHSASNTSGDEDEYLADAECNAVIQAKPNSSDSLSDCDELPLGQNTDHSKQFTFHTEAGQFKSSSTARQSTSPLFVAVIDDEDDQIFLPRKPKTPRFFLA